MTKNQLSIVLHPLLPAIILVCLLVSIFTVSNAPADTVESTPVTGITREVKGDILPGVNITLNGVETVVSDENGQYQIMATTTGPHNIVAHKDGFRDRTQTMSISGLGAGYAVTCNFQGTHGLIPNAPDMGYALDCINLWLYPPNPDTSLDIWTALAVINAWLYPVSPTPTPTPTPTPVPAPVADFFATPTICNGPTTVQFTDTSTGEITSWSWNFGDGHTSNLQNPTNYYNHNGYYTVTLTVTGTGGTDEETKQSYIYVYGCPT